MKIELFPTQGWSTFLDSQLLLDLVFEAITIKEHGGNWDYHNFTSNTSTWVLDKDVIMITFDELEEQKICAIHIESDGNEELEQFILHVTNKLGFVVVHR